MFPVFPPSRKIALISDFSGIVNRGAERIVDDFQRLLQGEVTVVSTAGCCSPGGKFPDVAQAKRRYDEVTRQLALLDWITRYILYNEPRRLIGTYDFFSSQGWLDFPFSRKLEGVLDELKPQIVISLGGFHSHRFLSHYCRENGIVSLGIYGGGPGWAMRVAASKMNQGIVVHTPFELQYMRHAESRLSSVLIPPGVQQIFFQPYSEIPDRMPDLVHLERPIFLSAAAMVPFKRLHFLIDAVTALGKGSLVMIGDGPLRTQLLHQAERQLGKERFYYAGDVSDVQQVAQFYRMADVYCLSSLNEPFGIVLLEAMASNKPIVATDDATRRWMIKDAGILVDVTNRQAFAGALWQAAKTNWGDKPRRRAEFFSLENVIAAWDELIEARLAGQMDYISPYEKEVSE